MRWIEGWLGTIAGVVGAVGFAGVLLYAQMRPHSERCYSAGPTGTSTFCVPATIHTPTLAIPFAGAILLFVAVLVGTWLDLKGWRVEGRFTLLMGAALLVPAWLIWLPNALYDADAMSLAPYLMVAVLLSVPLILLALVTAILACVRRDAPSAQG
jgi:hypothetical protein